MLNWTISPTLSTPSDCASTAIGELMTPDVAPESGAVVRFEAAMARPLAENAALQAALESIVDNFERRQPTAADAEGSIESAPPDTGSFHAEAKPVVESMPIRAEAEPIVVEARPTSFGEQAPARAEVASGIVKAQPPSDAETRSVVAVETPVAVAEKVPVHP